MVASTALHLLSLLNTALHSQLASQPASSATTTIPASSSPTPTTPPSPITANTFPFNSSSLTPPPRTPSVLILSRVSPHPPLLPASALLLTPSDMPLSSPLAPFPSLPSPLIPSTVSSPHLPRGSKGYAGGDEARMLQRQLSGRPVIIAVGRKRADVARRVIGQFGAWRGWGRGAAEGERHEGRKEEGMEHGGADKGSAGVGPVAAVIMDDGMQHWALHRDLDIVMLNAVPPHAHTQPQVHVQVQGKGQSGCNSPWGNGQLVPRGPMRERLEALQRADVVVIHNSDLVTSVADLGRGDAHLLLCHGEGGAGEAGEVGGEGGEVGGEGGEVGGEGGEVGGEGGGGDRVVACASVAGRDAVCLSAIGSPEALQATLQAQLHLRRVVSIALPDHSPFSLREVRAVQEALALLSHAPDPSTPSHDAQDPDAHGMRRGNGGGEGDAVGGRGPLLILTEKPNMV
ncbi:unnamed protein product [Closterium sp. Yama58-4]|nr:unnamed protein product [Closterium sp. Yama58-4]